jgi:hypothetical protein
MGKPVDEGVRKLAGKMELNKVVTVVGAAAIEMTPNQRQSWREELQQNLRRYGVK